MFTLNNRFFKAHGGQPLSAVDLMTQPSHVVIKQEIMDEPMEVGVRRYLSCSYEHFVFKYIQTEDMPPPRVESPQLEEEPEDPLCFPVPDDSKWVSIESLSYLCFYVFFCILCQFQLQMLAITDDDPITSRSRKVAVPLQGRFTSAEKVIVAEFFYLFFVTG